MRSYCEAPPMESAAVLCLASPPSRGALRPENVSRRQANKNEVARFPYGQHQISALQQQREETLGKILRLLLSGSLAASRSINRSPIGATKFFECLLCRGRFALRFQDHAPMRGRKRYVHVAQDSLEPTLVSDVISSSADTLL